MPGAEDKEGAGVFAEPEEWLDSQEITRGAELPPEAELAQSQRRSRNWEPRAEKGSLEA